MAKFPRSKRKMFQIQKKVLCWVDGMNVCANCTEKCCWKIGTVWEVWGMTGENKWGILEFFETKKEARQYVSRRRRAIKNRLW